MAGRKIDDREVDRGVRFAAALRKFSRRDDVDVDDADVDDVDADATGTREIRLATVVNLRVSRLITVDNFNHRSHELASSLLAFRAATLVVPAAATAAVNTRRASPRSSPRFYRRGGKTRLLVCERELL